MILRMTATAICALTLLSAPARAENLMMPLVGSVTSVAGHVTLAHAGLEGKAVAVTGATIHRNDRIETGDDGRIAITFTDGTLLTLGAHGSMTVDDYTYTPEKPEESKAHLNILGAAFRYVSGKIAKTPAPDVTLGLDFGSIGIRGTELVRAMRDGQCWIYLKKGEITVSNDGGAVTLAPDQMTRMGDKAVAPAAPAPFADADIAWVEQEIAWPAGQ